MKFQKTISAALVFLTMISVTVFNSTEATAQQIPLYSGYMVNPYLLSPSFAGNYTTTQKGRLMAMSRIQFAEIEGAPVTYLASADSRFDEQNMGLGGMVFTDSYGLLRQTGANLSYAYHTSLGAQTHLSFGLSAQVIQHGIDFEKIRAEDRSENILAFESASKTLFNGSFGLHLRHQGFTLGFVAPQVLGTQLVHKDYVSNTEVSYQFERHYIGFMGYSFNTENNNWQFDPMMVMRAGRELRPQFDVILKTTYKDQVFASVGYRSDYAMSFGGGINVNQSLCFAYTYDLPVNDIAGFSGGSHEFGLLFNLMPSANSYNKIGTTKATPKNLELMREIDDLKQEIASGKENLQLQKAEVDRLNAILTSYQKELDSLKSSNMAQFEKLVAIKENIESKVSDEEQNEKKYYLVIASLKSQKEAFEYQQNLKRKGETGSTFLKQSKSDTWFFVCSQKFDDANKANAALQSKLKNFDKSSYLRPWIYIEAN